MEGHEMNRVLRIIAAASVVGALAGVAIIYAVLCFGGDRLVAL